MQAHFDQHIPDGELRVHMNPGSGSPFGVIDFTDQASIHVESDEDADRIIRAAARLKAMRAKLGTPHQHEPGAGKFGRHCEVCGDLNDEDHWKPDATAVIARAIADGTPVIVADDGYPDVADDESEGLYETRMACGDSLADAAPYAEGAPMWCPRHGETTAITPEQWLGLTTVEHEVYPAGAPDEPQPHHSQATGYIALDMPTLAGNQP